jgi:hypothetical protein
MNAEITEKLEEKFNDLYSEVEKLRQFLLDQDIAGEAHRKEYFLAIRILNRFQDDLSEDLYFTF